MPRFVETLTMYGNLCAGFAVLASLALLLLRWRCVLGTTLVSAYGWAVATLIVWLSAILVSLFDETVSPTTRDALWYLAGVISVCPGIAVLGARRPVAGVWTAFVVLPLILVLGLPLLSAWRGNDGRFGWLVLETPFFLGFCLVVLMGTGNYVGTRFTFPAVLAGAATIWVAKEFRFPAMADATLPQHAGGQFVIAALLLSAAIAVAFLQTRRGRAEDEPAGNSLERLWHDFRNQFGIVWAKRVGERVNRAAEEERLSARIDISGIVWMTDTPDSAEQTRVKSRLEFTLRRLLKRFVDPEWIELRTAACSPSVDAKA